jgi:hypothetical protein
MTAPTRPSRLDRWSGDCLNGTELLAGWDRLEDRTEGARGSPARREWQALLHGSTARSRWSGTSPASDGPARTPQSVATRPGAVRRRAADSSGPDRNSRNSAQ